MTPQYPATISSGQQNIITLSFAMVIQFKIAYAVKEI
jgi:hypothetical protein